MNLAAWYGLGTACEKVQVIPCRATTDCIAVGVSSVPVAVGEGVGVAVAVGVTVGVSVDVGMTVGVSVTVAVTVGV